MRAYEFINENNDNIIKKPIPIMYGGGIIEIYTQYDNLGDVEYYSYTYVNKFINPDNDHNIIKVEVKDFYVNQYHFSRYPEGLEYGRINSGIEVKELFANEVTPYIRMGYQKYQERKNMKSNKNELNETDLKSFDPWRNCKELQEISKIMDEITLSANRRLKRLKSEGKEPVNKIKLPK